MRIVIIGCGVVGAAIAYELSQLPNLEIIVLEEHAAPATGSTGAALGVLMAAISQKLKGHALKMRLFSIQQYNQWIPKLEAITGQPIPFNRQGILRLCFAGEDLDVWQSLAAMRHSQGWELQMCDRSFLSARYPYLNLERVIAAVYSPHDRQVDPSTLTRALVAVAHQNGVTFQFNTKVENISNPTAAIQIQTSHGCLNADRLVIAAGIGSSPFTQALQQPMAIRPVLGQAVRVKLPALLDSLDRQPVITGNDVHLVPLGNQDYWIGATVEFPSAEEKVVPSPDPTLLDSMMQQAIEMCPAIREAIVLQQWYGLRPRPEGRPAPIVEPLSGYPHILLATGHYRNGILLAPATADQVRAAIIASIDRESCSQNTENQSSY